MDHAPGRRGHGHRGRRGSDRRGQDRRPQPQAPQQPRGEQVDVESIMRDIRARIAKQSGIDLSEHQIQELAARRLESILDVRALNPALMEQLRRSAGGKSAALPAPAVEAPAQLDETSLFEGGLRGVFKSILKLFFLNPRPLVDAINAHATATADIVRREAERNRQQLEWNALHFELLKRLVTEVSRASLESQGLGLRVESLATKVDFNERRVRGLEGTVHDATAKAVSMPPPTRSGDDVVPAPSTGGDAAGLGDAQRRKRRRRRGRRGNMPGEFTPGAAPGPAGADAVPPLEDDDAGFDEGIGEDAIAPGAESNAPPASPAPEPREAATPTEPAEPPTTRWTQVTGPPPAVTPQVSTSDAPSVAPSPEPHSDESVQG